MTDEVKPARRRLSPADKALEAVRAEAARQDKVLERRNREHTALAATERQVEEGKARLAYLLQHPDMDAEERDKYRVAYLQPPEDDAAE